MKKFTRFAFGFFMIFFFLANMFLIITGVNVSKQIHEYEVRESGYKEENGLLETEISKISSLQYAASMSAVFAIDQSIQPIYLNNVSFALNR